MSWTGTAYANGITVLGIAGSVSLESESAGASWATLRAKRYFWFGAVVHPTDSSQGLENLNRIALIFLHVAFNAPHTLKAI